MCSRSHPITPGNRKTALSSGQIIKIFWKTNHYTGWNALYESSCCFISLSSVSLSFSVHPRSLMAPHQPMEEHGTCWHRPSYCPSAWADFFFRDPTHVLLAHHTCACASVWEHLHGQREDRCVAEDNIGTPHGPVFQRAPFLSFSVTITQWKTPSPLRWRIPYWLSWDTNQILVVTINERANEVLRSPALTEVS